jgi:SAM-dependent methyltransferase
MDIVSHNRKAWDRWVEKGCPYTIPVSPEAIEAAKRGDWEVYLTSKPVPRDWFPPDLHGLKVLGLASGGGQQGPILAAAGAQVMIFDNSPQQLQRDRLVAEQNGLEIATLLGDMQDLSALADESFDLVFHPVSNVFVPDVRPVWRGAYRVLKRGGLLLSGMVNPVEYAFDRHLADEKGIYQLKHALPYSDLTSISEEERVSMFGKDEPLEFSHTLEELIGGQIEAGFVITGFYESHREDDPIGQYLPTYIATRALKM